MKNTPKIVTDTNIILSAYLFGGKPQIILTLAGKKEIQIITSLQILAECVDVLRKKFRVNDSVIARFQEKIKKRLIFVEPRREIHFVSRDPDDDKFIEAAVEGKCDYIVTGDQDLLDLKQYKKIKIVKPAEFLKLIETNGE